MLIYIDESGGFIPGAVDSRSGGNGTYSAVAAYVVAESSRRRMQSALKRLKRDLGVDVHGEIKLRDVDERQYLHFLSALADLNAVLLACFINTEPHSESAIKDHQAVQVQKARESLAMVSWSAEQLAEKTSQIETYARLSPQLYVQMTCQCFLFTQLLYQAVNYFGSSAPQALGHFAWRIDPKGRVGSIFDDSLRWLAPIMVQTRALQSRLIHIGGDLRFLDRYSDDDPDDLHLRQAFDMSGRNKSYDLHRIMTEDLDFPSSETSPGIQVVDLLVSGITRCLRQGFKDNDRIAGALGGLMIAMPDGSFPIEEISLVAHGAARPNSTLRTLEIMSRCSRQIVV